MALEDGEMGNAGWWQALAGDDPAARRKLLRVLLPLAMQTLRERFGLIELHGGNEASKEAALYSAWSSFHRHYHEDDFENIRDLESLAGHLVRIAYNRWQRDRNAQRKVDRAVGEGAVRDGSGREPLRVASPKAKRTGGACGWTRPAIRLSWRPVWGSPTGGYWFCGATNAVSSW